MDGGDPQVDIAKAQLCHVFFSVTQKRKESRKNGIFMFASFFFENYLDELNEGMRRIGEKTLQTNKD